MTALPAATRLRAAVFDLDGTLIDSLPLVLRAFAHALEPFGPRPTMEIFARLGGPPERVFSDLLGGSRHVPAAIERLEAFNRDNHHLIRPFDGASAFLERLRSSNQALAIWTGRDRETTEHLMAAHGLTGFFDTVLCGDDLPTHKPDPQGLSEILRRLEIGPAEAVFVGDADVDVLGGAACGVDTILISHGRAVDAALQARAWKMVSSPGEAYRLVMERMTGDGTGL